jgi:hypothetical protein
MFPGYRGTGSEQPGCIEQPSASHMQKSIGFDRVLLILAFLNIEARFNDCCNARALWH